MKSLLLHGMENVFSSQISAYQKNFNSKHVLVRLIKGWREHLNKDFVIGGFEKLVKSR